MFVGGNGKSKTQLNSNWDWGTIHLLTKTKHAADKEQNSFKYSEINTGMPKDKSELSRNTTKPTKWPVRPAKTHISQGIRQVWSELPLSAWRKLGSLATHWAHSEDSDQSGRMPTLIWVFAGSTGHFVEFVMLQLN